MTKDKPFEINPADPEAYRIGKWNHGKLGRVDLRDIFPGIEEVNFEIRRGFDRIMNLSLDASEMYIICGITKFIGAQNVLEIGTSDGNTALNLAANIPDSGKVTTVDLPLNFSGEFDLTVPDFRKNITDRDRVGIQFQGTGFEGKIHQILCDSAVLDFSNIGGPFDLIFIDGCHYYDYVRRDTENALKNIKPGGVLVWHDYGQIDDVSRVVDEYIDILGPQVVRGTRLAIAVAPGECEPKCP